jgi:hypothetical protein
MMISDEAFNGDISKKIEYPPNPIICVSYEPLSHSARPNLLRNLSNGGRVAIFQGEIGQELFEHFAMVRPSYVAGFRLFVIS